MTFLRNLAQIVLVKYLAAIVLALLAIIGLGPEFLVRLLTDWWSANPSGFALNATRYTCLSLAVAGIILAVWPRIKRRYFPGPVQHVEHLHIAAGMSPQGCPALLLATVRKSMNQLTVLLEYSWYYTALSGAGWTSSRRVQLATLKNVIAGHQLSLPIVSTAIDHSSLWWGNANDETGNLIEKSKKYRAKIRFVDDNHDEQAFRFGLLRTCPDRPPYVVEVFTEADLNH
jgi:hypothetical protein